MHSSKFTTKLTCLPAVAAFDKVKNVWLWTGLQKQNDVCNKQTYVALSIKMQFIRKFMHYTKTA